MIKPLLYRLQWVQRPPEITKRGWMHGFIMITNTNVFSFLTMGPLTLSLSPLGRGIG